MAFEVGAGSSPPMRFSSRAWNARAGKPARYNSRPENALHLCAVVNAARYTDMQGFTVNCDGGRHAVTVGSSGP